MCTYKMRERRKKKKYARMDKTIIARLSKIVYIKHVFVFLLLVVAMIIIVSRYQWLWYLFAIPVLYLVAGIIFESLRRKNTVLTFADGRLTCRQGILSCRTTVSPAVNILSVTVEKGLFSHMLDYGNIRVVTANDEMYFRTMDCADEFAEAANQYLVDITRRT